MFERYTERARQCIFFARYEASQFGIPYIEAEHILLGILRADAGLRRSLFSTDEAVEALRERFKPPAPGERVSTSVDLPVSKQGRRIMAQAEKEADQLG